MTSQITALPSDLSLHLAPSMLSVSSGHTHKSTRSAKQQANKEPSSQVQIDVKVHLDQSYEMAPSQIAAALAESARQLAQSAANFEEDDKLSTLSHSSVASSRPSMSVLSAPHLPYHQLHARRQQLTSAPHIVRGYQSRFPVTQNAISQRRVSLDRSAYAVSLNRPGHAVSLDRNVQAVSLDRPGHAVSLDRPGHAVSLDRPGHAVSLDRPGHAVSLDRPGQAVSLDRPGHAVSLDRPGQAVSLDRPGHAVSLDRPGHAVSLDRPGQAVSLDRPGHAVSLDRPGHAVSLDRPGHAVSLDRNGHAVSLDRNGHAVSLDRHGHAVSPDRPGHMVSLDRPGHAVSLDRRGHVVSLDRPGHAVRLDRPGYGHVVSLDRPGHAVKQYLESSSAMPEPKPNLTESLEYQQQCVHQKTTQESCEESPLSLDVDQLGCSPSDRAKRQEEQFIPHHVQMCAPKLSRPSSQVASGQANDHAAHVADCSSDCESCGLSKNSVCYSLLPSRMAADIPLGYGEPVLSSNLTAIPSQRGVSTSQEVPIISTRLLHPPNEQAATSQLTSTEHPASYDSSTEAATGTESEASTLKRSAKQGHDLNSQHQVREEGAVTNGMLVMETEREAESVMLPLDSQEGSSLHSRSGSGLSLDPTLGSAISGYAATGSSSSTETIAKFLQISENTHQFEDQGSSPVELHSGSTSAQPRPRILTNGWVDPSYSHYLSGHMAIAKPNPAVQVPARMPSLSTKAVPAFSGTVAAVKYPAYTSQDLDDDMTMYGPPPWGEEVPARPCTPHKTPGSTRNIARLDYAVHGPAGKAEHHHSMTSTGEAVDSSGSVTVDV